MEWRLNYGSEQKVYVITFTNYDVFTWSATDKLHFQILRLYHNLYFKNYGLLLQLCYTMEPVLLYVVCKNKDEWMVS